LSELGTAQPQLVPNTIPELGVVLNTIINSCKAIVEIWTEQYFLLAILNLSKCKLGANFYFESLILLLFLVMLTL
jgi:hypothetical protein